ncbi:MAG TPA: thioredoxin family protein [Phenylobacterium sp.]|nr:thioredoxin family protein [Phenylobacterium sp.]
MKRFIVGTLAALGLSLAVPAAAAPVKTAHVTVELVPQSQGVTPGGVVQVALRQDIQSGWHTYWKNSGDSGAPTEITWTLPAGWKAGDIVWAPPARQPTGPLMNYGYHDQVLLPVAITAPKSARPGETVTLKAHASLLVCADVCVPEDADLTLDLPVVAAAPAPDATWGARITQALDASPKAGAVTGAVAKDGKVLKLAVTGAALKGADMADAYFYPFASDAIDHAKPQAIERGPQGLTLTLAPSFGKEDAPAPALLAGVLEVGGKAYEVAAAPGALPPAAAGLGPPPAKAARAAAGAGVGMGLIGAIAFAFVGGLILNLMPCVFPILAMKATSLAGHAHERRAAQSQGLAFLAGVLATFLALAGLLIAVRAGGAAVGWGFQLQSPPVVAGLALLMLAVALNLSGLFEIGASLQGMGSRAAARGGLAGAFFTGTLAVVVAAPCTAPFMAPALGWALTQPAAAALAVFFGLGLGFAAPFTLAAFIPALLARLPKPGGWMEGFRKLMAFPMYGTAAWLAWVLAVQSGSDALARLFAAAVVLALAAWILGVAQRQQAAGGRPLVAGVTGAVLLVVAVLGASWPNYPEAATGPASQAQGSDIPYEPYSPEKLAEAQAAGKPVFINFTAAWCVTCQVNEKVAFSTKAAAEAFRTSGAVYLKADWTRRDAAIADELARHGRAGVPLYLVYGTRGGEPAVLPQVLTGDIVARALRAAAG